MRTCRLLVVLLIWSVHLAPSAEAQDPGCVESQPGGIPVDSVVHDLGGFPLKICFLRLPTGFQSAATNWGNIGTAVPVLHTSTMVTIGGVALGTGGYGLHFTPRPGEWLLHLIRLPDPGFEENAGSIAEREVGRAYVPVERAVPPSEVMDITIRGSGSTAVLIITWGDTEIAFPIVQR